MTEQSIDRDRVKWLYELSSLATSLIKADDPYEIHERIEDCLFCPWTNRFPVPARSALINANEQIWDCASLNMDSSHALSIAAKAIQDAINAVMNHGRKEAMMPDQKNSSAADAAAVIAEVAVPWIRGAEDGADLDLARVSLAGIIEKTINTETARLREIVNRLPSAWRFDHEKGWVQDVPMIPGIGEHRWIACEEYDTRWARNNQLAGVYEVEIVRRLSERGRTEMRVVLKGIPWSPVNWWRGPIWATKEDAERALAEMQTNAQEGVRDESKC